MKIHAFILAAAMAAAPLGTLAQEQPSAPPMQGPPGMQRLTPEQRQELRSDMQATMKQVRQIHQQTRTQILNALTPEHRNLLAQVVGALAIAPSPDPHAAADRLNAALSPGERQTIISAAQNERKQMVALREQMRAKVQAVAPMPSHAPRSPRPEREHRAPNAGAILLMMARGGGHGPMMMGRPGMMGGPEQHR